MSGEREAVEAPIPVSVPLWGVMPFVALLVLLAFAAGGDMRDFMAVTFAAAFSFQFWWLCAIRGDHRQRRSERRAALDKPADPSP